MNRQTMALAIRNQEIAKSFLLCVRCKKIGRFVCERCSDRYCSKACQVFDWPNHRKICIPMPSLLEIPIDGLSEGHMLSMYDQRVHDNLALTYHTTFQNRYQSESGNYNDRRSGNFSRVSRGDGEPFMKPFRQEMDMPKFFESIDSGEMENLALQKMNSVFEVQPNFPNTIRKVAAADSNDSDEIVNLATSNIAASSIKRDSQNVTQKPPSWDEDNPDHIYDLERSTLNGFQNWQKPFTLERDSFVMVVHYDESPTVNCWIVQNQHKTRRQQLLDELQKLHCSNDCAELQTVTTNEVYSVSYKDKYYRGECLYQINSKDVLVRLIDVGLTCQAKISKMKSLSPRVKAVPAFALQIHFEKSLDVTIGQLLKIKQFTVDKTGNVNVTLRSDGKPTRSDQNPIKIDTISIPVGVPLDLFCLDYSNLDKGYFSACVHDPKRIESINALSDKIRDYLKPFGIAGSYCPKLDEICFAYHRSERQWYRAQCIGVMGNDKFDVIFIDYGITNIVTSANLRKFSAEFSEPSLMHFCRIKALPAGMRSDPPKELVRKIVKYFDENPIFPITSAQYNDGMLIIDCPRLMEAIS